MVSFRLSIRRSFGAKRQDSTIEALTLALASAQELLRETYSECEALKEINAHLLEAVKVADQKVYEKSCELERLQLKLQRVTYCEDYDPRNAPLEEPDCSKNASPNTSSETKIEDSEDYGEKVPWGIKPNSADEPNGPFLIERGSQTEGPTRRHATTADALKVDSRGANNLGDAPRLLSTESREEADSREPEARNELKSRSAMPRSSAEIVTNHTVSKGWPSRSNPKMLKGSLVVLASPPRLHRMSANGAINPLPSTTKRRQSAPSPTSTATPLDLFVDKECNRPVEV